MSVSNVTSATSKPYISPETSSTVNVKQKSSMNTEKDFDINGLILLMQELFQKLRNTLQDQTVKQSINSFNIIKSSVEKKQEAANKNQTAGIVSAVVGGAGGLLSIGATFSAGKLPGITKRKPDGMMSDNQLAKMQSKIDDFAKPSLKPKNEQLAELDKAWEKSYSSMPQEQQMNFKSGILDIKDGKLKDSEKVSATHDKLKEFSEKIAGDKRIDQETLYSWVKQKKNSLDKIDSSLNKLNPHSFQSSSEAIKMAGIQVGPSIANSAGQLGSSILTKEATGETISAEYLKDNHAVYSKQQEIDSNNMRAYSQKLTDVTRSLVDIYGAMINATNWK